MPGSLGVVLLVPDRQGSPGDGPHPAGSPGSHHPREPEGHADADHGHTCPLGGKPARPGRLGAGGGGSCIPAPVTLWTLWLLAFCFQLIWLVTFVATILVNLDLGLVVAVVFSLLLVVARTQL